MQDADPVPGTRGADVNSEMLGTVALTVLAATSVASQAGKVALVTGATGRTGSLIYFQLKQSRKFAEVRALVVSLEKAKQVLNCSKCDASEGIYLGNVTQPDTISPAMTNVSTLAICVGASPDAAPGLQQAIEFTGVQNQLTSLAAQAMDHGMQQVLLISSMGTTQPSPTPSEGGSILFWKLNAEAFLMASGIPFTIVKPCGLLSTPGGRKELLVGHDDTLLSTMPPIVPRADVASVMSHAAASHAVGLRFDLCSKVGTPTTDYAALLKAAQYP